MQVLPLFFFITFSQHGCTGIDQFELPRGARDTIVYGKEELKILIEEALKNTERRGRDLAIQTCLFMVLSSITALRPSSLGPSNAKLKEKKKVSGAHSKKKLLLIFDSFLPLLTSKLILTVLSLSVVNSPSTT